MNDNRGKLLAPSLLSCDFSCVAEQIRLVEPYSDLIHADIMDGHFVPNITFGPPVIKKLRKNTTLPIDCHLMIENPNRLLESFAKAGGDYVSVHQEVCPHLNRTLHLIRELGMKAGVALNPSTAVDSLEWILEDVDFVLLMSVNPGFGGQAFLPVVLPKIRRVREMLLQRGLDLPIEVDGGVSETTIPDLLEAGADWFVAGSAVFGGADPAGSAKKLRGILNG